MTVASLSFLGFAAISALLYNAVLWPIWRSGVMLAANLLFLASFTTDITTVFPMAAFLAIGFASIKLVETQKSDRLLAILVIVLIAGFCWLKKYFFLSFLEFLPWPYLTLGLSYIFFRVLALVIDTAHGEFEKPISILDYVNFTLNFPTLTAGPIQRYQEYLESEHPLTWVEFGEACQRIVVGLFKIIALSGVLGMLQKSAVDTLLHQSDLPAVVWFGLIGIGLYPLFLYYNFSGYTDIVIGVGHWFGRRYPENFNFPFSSGNFIEFWSRWHMTLSNWLRDYLYTPLLFTLLRRFDRPGAENYLGALAFFVTFFVIGIWHGSTVAFAIYGLLLGLGVSVNKLYQTMMIHRLGRSGYRQLCVNPIYKAAARGLTFTWYAACMLFFWADAPEVAAVGAHLGYSGAIIGFLVLFVISSMLLSLSELILAFSPSIQVEHLARGAYPRSAFAGALIFLCFVAVLATSSAAPQIIYQAF
jgi:D-alanyl-lipoteichoic acid acyltransferase DltB (MBOAT superfamily)